MKTNLIEGDYNICKLLDGYWLPPAKVATKIMREDEDVSARMAKLTKRGLLDHQDGVYRLSLARRLAIKSTGVVRPHGDRWALICKTPQELAEIKAQRELKRKAYNALRREMRKQKVGAASPKKPPKNPYPKWFGVRPAAELRLGVQDNPKCFADRVEYTSYLHALKDSGEKTTSSGICRDCDRATMERMGQMCEAPDGIKARMTE